LAVLPVGSLRALAVARVGVDQTDARNARLTQSPKSVKEASSWWKGKIYIVHLRRLLNVRMPIMEMT
jgi:hypothetical protein